MSQKIQNGYYSQNVYKIPLKYAKKAPKRPPAGAYRGSFCKKKFTGKEQDAETGLYYYGARYLDPKTSRWLSGDPAMGDYIPGAPVNEEAKKRNGNLPGQGGVFNYVNLHTYHYAGNNPVKYTDPDGSILNNIHSYSKMNEGSWARKDTRLNSTGAFIKNEGCAITGMANIATSSSPGGGLGPVLRFSAPDTLNKDGNFAGKTDNLDWNSTAKSFGMTATRSENGNAAAAQKMLKNADTSPNLSSALAQVPITTRGKDGKLQESLHWVGVDGGLVDLNNDGGLWIKVSPTSVNDGAGRAINSNWKQGSDGNMYVNLSAVKGAVIVE